MANPTVDPNDTSFSGAILALLKALGGAIQPAVPQRPGQINDAVDNVENGQLPPPQSVQQPLGHSW
jgi:hypothetical protein